MDQKPIIIGEPFIHYHETPYHRMLIDVITSASEKEVVIMKGLSQGFKLADINNLDRSQNRFSADDIIRLDEMIKRSPKRRRMLRIPLTDEDALKLCRDLPRKKKKAMKKLLASGKTENLTFKVKMKS